MNEKNKGLGLAQVKKKKKEITKDLNMQYFEIETGEEVNLIRITQALLLQEWSKLFLRIFEMY